MIHHYARTRTRKRTIINNNLQTLLVTILLILHTPNLGKNNNNNIPLIYVSAQNDPTPVPTTLPPSPLPTNNPTNNPTATPTTSPTNSPTPVPTPIPTSSPTSTPTSSPTPLPTPSPTDSPSYKPSFTPVTPTSQNQLQSFTQEKIKMTFTGLSPLNKEEKAYLEEVTNTYIMTYFELSRSDIYDVTVDIEVTEMDPPYTGTDDVDTDEDNSSDTDADASGNGARRFRLLKGFTNTKIGMNGSLDANVNMRRLTDTNTFAIHSKRGRKTRTRNMQDLPQLSITYDHFMSYRIKDAANPKPEDLIKEPFSLLLDRSNYIAMLKNNQGGSNSNAQAFANLDKVSPPELISGKESVSMAGIIAGAVGGAVVLVMVVLFVLWRKRKKQRDQVPFDDDYNPARRRGNGVEMSNGILPSDGGSTLVEPSQQGVYTTGQSVVGGRYGPGSIATDDPDYQYQNPYEDPTIVSNTDGTLGDATRQSTQLQGGESILGSGGAQSIFSDDQSFEAFRNRDGRREEVLEIYAPAGKLGVVIDTPDTGAPVLHRIKETCPIADQLQVGDKLIAVDDEDVRSMTAVRVSKLISQKSSNPQRKFTIVRHHNA